MYGPSYSSGDSDERVGFPTAVLYAIDKWVIFVVFVCSGLCGKSIMEVNEFYELYCVIWGW